jgi:hypothetical protein
MRLYLYCPYSQLSTELGRENTSLCLVNTSSYLDNISDYMMAAEITPDIVQWLLMDENVRRKKDL